MKLYLSTLALTILLLFLADAKITVWPFSISFGRGWLVLGIIQIMCGCICLKAQWYDDGVKRGKEMKQEVKEEINDKKIKEVI